MPQRAILETSLSALYPTRTWGQPDDEACLFGHGGGAGVPTRELLRLRHALAAATRAPVYYRAASDEDLAQQLWILCLGRAPALIDIRDGVAPLGELDATQAVRERYLRVSFSTVARLACVQEVALELEPAPIVGDAAFLRELAQPGVYDAKLLKRMRHVVDFLQASDIAHIDYGLLDVPWEGADGSEFTARWGQPPTLANWLFYASPTRVTATTAVF